MHEVQRRINECVNDNPGIHFNALVDELELAVGQVQYHVRGLLAEDELTKTSVYGRTHYYTDAYDEWERGAIALLRRETARDIIVYGLENEQIIPQDVADELGIARSTFEWHASNLIEQDILEKHYGEGGRVIMEVARPEETAELLSIVSPGVHDKLVDRFTRFVDHALDS